jgi:cytochrome c-type biogenesis protein CcmE
MKPKTIIGLVLIVGFSALLFLNFGQQVGGYMNFAEAEETGAHAHVVGNWAPEQGMNYDREQNLFTFYMKDDAGQVRQVQYPNPKPANFEDAEQLVVQGYTQGDVFVAEHILVKCPSKYNDARGLEVQATM